MFITIGGVACWPLPIASYQGCVRIPLGHRTHPLVDKSKPGAICAKELEQESTIMSKHVYMFWGLVCLLRNKMTLGNGYLGSCIDEERSEMRYLV